MNRKLFFLAIILTSCNFSGDGNAYFTTTVSTNEIVDNKSEIVLQEIKTFRISDRKTTSILTKVFNYNNDTRIKDLTGLTKEDGLQNYLLDSTFYDKNGNDTLKRSYVFKNMQWNLTQIFLKKFGQDNHVEFDMTESPFNDEKYYKKETYYKYNTTGKILSETEFECTGKNSCDSIFKKEYVYSPENILEKEISYTMKGNRWKQFKEVFSDSTLRKNKIESIY